MKTIRQLLLAAAMFMLVFAGFPVVGAGATGNEDAKEKQTEKQESQEVKQEEKKDEHSDQTTSPSSEEAEVTQKETTVEEDVKKDEVVSQKEETKQTEVKMTINPEPKEEETDPGKDNPNKSTQIHLHLKNCVNPMATVFVQLNGEWKEMSNPGNSPLYKLLDGGEFVKDDVTAFKLVFASDEELVVPVSDVRVGVEANGTINYWFEKCDLPVEEDEGETEDDGKTEDDEEDGEDKDPGNGNPNKSTQIHLHLKNCVNPMATVFVQLNGEWKEMSNPGNSPLYKLLDGGEFVKDDITAFKLLFTNGTELVVPVSDVKVGVEANGSVNYWIETCDQPVIEKDVFLTLNLMIDESYGKIDRAALLMKNGKRIDFKRMNQVLTITFEEEIDLDMIHGIELMSNGKTKLFLLSQLGKDVLTLNEGVAMLSLNWNMQGTLLENEIEEESQPVPVTNTNNDSGNGTGGSTVTNAWTGDVLPQTGEESRAIFYLLGMLLSAAGVILRFRDPLKN